MTAQTLIDSYAAKTEKNSVSPALTAEMAQAVLDESQNDSPTTLDTATYGNLNANAHNVLDDGLYLMSGFGSAFSGQPDYLTLNPAVPYECVLRKSQVGAVFIQQVTFLSAYEPTNRKLGIEYTRVGANLTGAISAGWTPIQAPRTFEVDSKATVSCLDGVETYITGFVASPKMVDFEYVPTHNAVRNASGTQVDDSSGSLILQLQKQSGGNVVLNISSETSINDSTWTHNTNSLRELTLTGNEPRYVNIDSFLGVWPDNALVRFKIVAVGGDVDIVMPTYTDPTYGAIEGFSAKWKMSQVI